MIDEMRGDLDLACERYERSVKLLRGDGVLGKLATTLTNLGVVYGKCGREDAAREAWREALTLHEKVGHEAGVASTLNNVGLLLARRGRPRDAIDYLERAVAIQERIGDKGELARMTGNLASAYSSLDRHADACVLLEQTLRLHTEIKDEIAIAETLRELADALNAMGIGDAQKYYLRAMEAFEAVGDKASAACTELDLAFALTNPSKAVTQAEHAVAVHTALGNNDKDLGAALDGLGLLYCEAGEYQKGIAVMERSLEITERSGDTKGLATLLRNLGAVCEQAKLHGKAIRYYEQALPLVEPIEREVVASAIDLLRDSQA